jgi:hypothetical protein
MTSLRKTAALSLCLALLAAPAMAQDESQVLADSMDFAMHDALYTMYHEVGHMLVGELGLPVLGKEEDAAKATTTAGTR